MPMSKEIEISPFGSLLVYKKGYTADDVRSILEERNLKGLRIFADLKEDRLQDLDFLRQYSFLEALSIASVDDYDFNFLTHLQGLKELSISIDGGNTIDLSRQTNLKTLTIQWRKGRIEGLEKLKKVSSLCLVEYSEDDFSAISEMTNLNELKVKTASVKNLNGIEHFAKLRSLLLGNCKRLSSIGGLSRLTNLTSLTFIMCPKIADYDPVGSLSNLQELEITDCGQINSIRFVHGLTSLHRLSLLGSTDIFDGDLLPAKSVKEMFYKHREHYNTKIENKEHDNLEKKNREKIRRLFGSNG